MTIDVDAMMERVEHVAREMFDAGAREMAMMAADGELDRLTIELAIDRARERAIARTPEIESVLNV